MTIGRNTDRAWMGRAVRRLEDAALLRGRGRFVDDIEMAGLLHASFVRSPFAHARLNGIDAARAQSLPGVHAVLTYADLRPLLTCDRVPLAVPVAAIRHHVDPCYLAENELTYVGEPVALVVAESRAVAEDAASLVELDTEVLPAVIDPRAGLAAGAPRARLDCPDNLVAHWVMRNTAIDAAFAGAAHCFAEQFRMHKGGGHSIEARGVVARFDPVEDLLTVWDSTQMPHKAARSGPGARPGGASGPRHRARRRRLRTQESVLCGRALAVPAAALLLKRPIKWVEDRLEAFTATDHERDQDWEVEAAASQDGKLLGLRGHFRHDHGSFTPSGLSLPPERHHQPARPLCAAGAGSRSRPA